MQLFIVAQQIANCMNTKTSTYSISEATEKTGISPYTLRYYDKEGLLPFVKRSSGKKRIFTEKDLLWISLIKCLKNTNMSIHDIKKFIDWYLEGDSTLKKNIIFSWITRRMSKLKLML